MHTRQGVAAPAHSELTITEIPFRPRVLPPCTSCCKGEVADHVWYAVSAVLGHHGPCNRLTFSLQIGLLMAAGGWRFCRCYRHELTPSHAAINRLLDPVHANFVADDLRQKAGL